MPPSIEIHIQQPASSEHEQQSASSSSSAANVHVNMNMNANVAADVNHTHSHHQHQHQRHSSDRDLKGGVVRPPLPLPNAASANKQSSFCCDEETVSTATTTTAGTSYLSLSSSSINISHNNNNSHYTYSSHYNNSNNNNNNPSGTLNTRRTISSSSSGSAILNTPITLHSQNSLFDMTMDESNDDDASYLSSAHNTPTKRSNYISPFSISYEHHDHDEDEHNEFRNNDRFTSLNDLSNLSQTLNNTSTSSHTMTDVLSPGMSANGTTMEVPNSPQPTTLYEQTEKSLANISESLSGSFCGVSSSSNTTAKDNNNGGVNMTDHPLNSSSLSSSSSSPKLRKKGGMKSFNESSLSKNKNSNSNSNNTTENNVSFSDTLVQNRLLDDFHYLLGSDVMPCCEEKNIFMSCLGDVSLTNFSGSGGNGDTNDNSMGHGCTGGMGATPSCIMFSYPDAYTESARTDTSISARKDRFVVRNRAGESWRARAYRIRRLREERMLFYYDQSESGGNSHTHNALVSNEVEETKGASRFFSSYSSSFTAAKNRRQQKKQQQGQNYSHHQLTSNHQRQINYTYSIDGHLEHIAAANNGQPPPQPLHSQSPSPSNYCWNMSQQKQQGRPKHEVNSDPLGRIIGDCIEPISPSNDDHHVGSGCGGVCGVSHTIHGSGLADDSDYDFENGNSFKDVDLCYDSDPGESSFRPRKKSSSSTIPVDSTIGITTTSTQNGSMVRSKSLSGDKVKSKKLRAKPNKRREAYFDPIQTSTTMEEDDEDNVTLGENCHSSNSSSSSTTRHPLLQSKKEKTLEKDKDILTNVQDALNCTWTLTWHPAVNQSPIKGSKTKMKIRKSLDKSKMSSTSSSDDTSKNNSKMPKSPRCIQLWFERGNRIRGNDIVEPKLMWRNAYHPELATHRKLNDSTIKGPYQVCLLSICRILEINDSIDRKKYPFAKKSCSFLIRTCDDEEYMFEAPTEEERNHNVYMWKLVVARLASQAVVGDGNKMVGEFFVPTSYGVP